MARLVRPLVSGSFWICLTAMSFGAVATLAGVASLGWVIVVGGTGALLLSGVQGFLNEDARDDDDQDDGEDEGGWV
jgi:hypothetical protein